MNSRTVREALDTIKCPKCGADPGEHCREDRPPPPGKHPMHVARMTAPAQPTKENA